MEIRNATAEELDECENVLRAAFAGYVRRLGREQTKDAYSWLPEAVSKMRVLVAVDQSRLVGVAVYEARRRTWTIEQVAVRPDNQGRGIGSALIHKIERDAKDAGALKLELDTAEIMSDLLRLYQKHGFKIARKGLPEHGRDDFVRVYMQKAL